MGSDRPYRKARSEHYIIEELQRLSGIQFDPKVAEQAVKLLESEEISKSSHAPMETIFAIRNV